MESRISKIGISRSLTAIDFQFLALIIHISTTNKMNKVQSKINLKIHSFYQGNSNDAFSEREIEAYLRIDLSQIRQSILILVEGNLISQTIVKQCKFTGQMLPAYKFNPESRDILILLDGKHKKPGRRTTATQAQSWEAIQKDPSKFSKIDTVYSYLFANRNKCFSRRQVEETLKIRVNTLTGILNQLEQEGLIGIEKEDICEWTGQSVSFYFAKDPNGNYQVQIF